MKSFCTLPILPLASFSPNPKPRLPIIRPKVFSSSSSFLSISIAGNSLRSDSSPAKSERGFASISCSAASLSGSSGGGGGDELVRSSGGGGGDGGGDGDGDRGEVVGDSAGFSDLVSDNVIILTVGGMSCGGCAASVKRILESQSQVSSATVEFEKETAIISVVPEAKALENWQRQLGQKLANHLTTCGFKSHLFDPLSMIVRWPFVVPSGVFHKRNKDNLDRDFVCDNIADKFLDMFHNSLEGQGHATEGNLQS